MNRTLFLHAGLPKTGTTFLQKDCFPFLNGTDFVMRYRSEHNASASETVTDGLDQWSGLRQLKNMFYKSPCAWAHFAPEMFSRLTGSGRPRGGLAQEDNTNLLVSHENLGITSRFFATSPDERTIDPFLFCAHLRELGHAARNYGFEAFKVLMMVRKQDSWLASRYAQSSFRIAGASQQDFEKKIAYLLAPMGGRFLQGAWLDYATIRNELIHNLGKDNVLVLPYECLESDRELFLSLLSRFFQTDVQPAPREAERSQYHVRRTGAGSWKLRPYEWQIRNSLFKRLRRTVRSLQFPGVGAEKQITLHEELSNRIMDEYRQSNRQLAEETSIDLSAYGYYKT